MPARMTTIPPYTPSHTADQYQPTTATTTSVPGIIEHWQAQSARTAQLGARHPNLLWFCAAYQSEVASYRQHPQQLFSHSPLTLLLMHPALARSCHNDRAAARQALALLDKLQLDTEKPPHPATLLSRRWLIRSLAGTPSVSPELLRTLDIHAAIIRPDPALQLSLSRQNWLSESLLLAQWIDGYRDCQLLGQLLQISDSDLALSRIKRLEQLIQLRRRWLGKLGRQTPTAGNHRFPPPPLPGNQDIVPLTTLAELLQESQQQDHCATLRLHQILRGNSYLYKLTQPERATLEIRRSASGWHLEQLKQHGNLSAGSRSYTRVLQWLQQAQTQVF